MRHTHARHRRGLTLIEVAIVVTLLSAAGLVMLMYFQGSSRTVPKPMKNMSQLRGLHQCAVIFSQSNGFYLPGLDASGEIISDGPKTGFSGPGSAVASRFWILLDGQFIPPEMLANPRESLSAKWTTGTVSAAHYSYAALRIAGTDTDAGRMVEWKDSANSNAVLISDRNIGKSRADRNVRSLWTTTAGDWKGSLVWGDNHAEFSTSHKVPKTRYLTTSNTNDNIFVDESGSAGSNALMVR